jgi:serine/threonine protein kinase
MDAHLGSGYFADVFRTGRLAAKVFRGSAQAAAAAVHELAALADIAHGLAPALHGSFCDENRTFVLMELIEGASLRERVEAQGPLAPPEVRRIFREVAAALESIAARGWVCCDLHPRNIHPWTPTGARLLDFDGARAIGAK